jgi:hypothetical protein
MNSRSPASAVERPRAGRDIRKRAARPTLVALLGHVDFRIIDRHGAPVLSVRRTIDDEPEAALGPIEIVALSQSSWVSNRSQLTVRASNAASFSAASSWMSSVQTCVAESALP